MMKRIRMMAAMLCVGLALHAQEPADSLKAEDDNYDFTFTESQLDEDADAASTISSIYATRTDPYLNKVGFLFSPMRFRIRAYDNVYNETYLNGVMMNDVESGRFSYALIGGMNDATRNKESLGAFDNGMFGLTPVGGATNINLRASQLQQGHKVTLSACNRNYVARAMYTYATGLMDNGWALAMSLGYRWAKEGVIEGTFYNSLSYFLSAEKVFNDHHTLNLVTFGSPTERAQQAASTEEAYWLANSHYYNPNWGYQNGKKRNARIVHSYEPTAILTWDWKLDDYRKLTTSAGFKYTMYSTSALGWNGDAYDPRPDYYKNLPSSVFDVYDPDKNNGTYLSENPFLLDQYQELYDYWTSSKANRQINWDRMYYVNRQAGEALYYQERRHNDQMQWTFNTAWNHMLDEFHKYTLGVQLSTTKGMHYKTMDDLLGGATYVDIDKFAANDYGRYSSEAQNDLNHPNRVIKEGDKFGYNYNMYVNKAKLWGQYLFPADNFTILLGAHFDGTSLEREGLMKNGRGVFDGYDNSFGKSGAATFFGGGGRAVINFHPSANHVFQLATGYERKAPLARNAFVSPRIHNNFVDNLTNEGIFNSELSYTFHMGAFSGKVSGYYTQFTDQVEQTAYYNDQQSTFTYLTMSGVSKDYYGVEAALRYQVNGSLSFSATGTIGDAKYTNNPLAQVSYEGVDANEIAKLNTFKNPVTGADEELRVIADGMRVNGSPMTALSLGFNYNRNNWFFEGNATYYDRSYIAFSQYRRLNSTYTTAGKVYTPTSVDANGNLTYGVDKATIEKEGGLLYDAEGNLVKAYAAEQEKFDGGFMFDASIGRYIRMKKGRTMSINLSLQNIGNNTNMKTGGYEQNRDDSYYKESGGVYTKGENKAYRFSRNSKYYYANAFNIFLNVNFRF